MANKPANAKQKKWMSDIAEWSTSGMVALYGDEYCGAIPQLHHVTGRSARNNKIHIGHWFIIPVPIQLHDVSSNHPLNVTHHKHAFTEEFGFQSDLFQIMYSVMEREGYDVPPIEVYHAIMDIRK